MARGVQVGGGEVARGEADRRPPAHLEAEARRRRSASASAPSRMVAVLLREDVRHVLLGDGALEAADDRGREPVGVVLPRPAAVPGERARGRAGGRARRRCAARRGARGASSHDVLDEQLAAREQPVAMPVRDAGPSRGGRARRRCRSRARGDELELRAGRARARASAAARRSPLGTSGRPSLSVGARQSCRRGPPTSTFRPSSASSREHARVEVDDGADAAGLEHAVAPGAARRGRVRRFGCARRQARAAARRPRGRPAPSRSRRAGRSGR